jgi:RNA polymerase primary sigma factor
LKNKKNALSDYLRSLYNIPTLSRDIETELAHKIANGDELALEKLVTHNLRFVVTVIKSMPHWTHSSVDMEDMLGFGNEALILAARKWKPMGRIRFASYAKKVIITEVNRAVANTKNIIRLPVNITEEIRKNKYAERMLTQELQRSPTDKELANYLGTTVERVSYINSILNKEPISMEAFNTDHLKEEDE